MLAIAGGKGGCGKTTTAIGVAWALVRRGDRPLVVDADCDMPNLHTTADVDRRPGLDALCEGASFDRVVHESRSFPGVDVLPAGAATGALSNAACRRLRWHAGPVLLDCPAGASDAAASPLRAADDALVVTTADTESLVDAAKTARMARALDSRVLGAVLTRMPEDAAPAAADPLPPECPTLAAVPSVAGDPLASSVGRAAYERLATRLSERNI